MKHHCLTNVELVEKSNISAEILGVTSAIREMEIFLMSSHASTSVLSIFL